MEVFTNIRDESLKIMVDELWGLIAAAETIKHEDENIRQFSEHMIYVRELIVKLQSQQPRAPFAGGSMAGDLLRRMEIAINNAREAIEGYKSKSSLLRMRFSRSVLSQLNKSSNEIDDVLSLLPLTHIKSSFDISANVEAIINSLKSMVLKFEATNVEIQSRLCTYVSENGGNRQQKELRLLDNLPTEADEIQICESINEEGQLTQMLQSFPGAMETASPIERDSVDEILSPPTIFFYCPLSFKLMEDPVNVSCNHTYDRKAIEEYFRSGQKLCPLCQKELISSSTGNLELTPNSSLLNAISEWKQRKARGNAERNAKKKIRDASAIISEGNTQSINGALEDLKTVMKEMPSCIREATNSSCNLIPKLAMLLKDSQANTRSVLRCILLIARFSDENKEIIGTGGVIKCLLKHCKTEPIALKILLELYASDKIAQNLKNNKKSIPILVSLLDNPNSYIAETADAMLKNLSTNINNTILMAKSGYFPPFLHMFSSNENEEMRAFMADELANMNLAETKAINLENEQFIAHLSAMLISDSTAIQLASLKCIKRLMPFHGIRSSFLSTVCTIPALLFLIADTTTVQNLKKEAFEILSIFIETSQPVERESNPGLQRLYSHSSIHDFLEQINASNPENQLSLLGLLNTMFQNSDTARDWIISDQEAMRNLFSAFSRDKNSEVRLNALKLVYCITKNYPNEIALPPSPAMETQLNSILSIFTKSRIDEEVSIAANIISHLPIGDEIIDEMLQNSYVLKAIHSLISRANTSIEMLENILGALLRCLNRSNLVFQTQVSKLEPFIVQMLPINSPLVKQRAAMILAHLARCTPESPSSQSRTWRSPFPTHNIGRPLVCLVKGGAVRPLIEMVDAMNPDVSEAALMALDTLFGTDNSWPSTSQSLFSAAAAGAIVENEGAAPILEVLEKGPLFVKKAALDLFGKIYRHPGITSDQLSKFRAILFYLFKEDELKDRAKKILVELVD